MDTDYLCYLLNLHFTTVMISINLQEILEEKTEQDAKQALRGNTYWGTGTTGIY